MGFRHRCFMAVQAAYSGVRIRELPSNQFFPCGFGFDGARISSIDRPCLRRFLIVQCGSPVTSAHSTTVRVLPSCVSLRLRLLLRACSVRVAQRQLSGSYGPFTSLRSRLCRAEGLGPKSAIKASKLSCHRAHTTIPRPPYSAYPTTVGTVHLRSMPYQAWYSGVHFGVFGEKFRSIGNLTDGGSVRQVIKGVGVKLWGKWGFCRRRPCLD